MDVNGFRSFGDGREVDLLALVRSVLAEDPKVELSVGSDSQNKDRFTIYSTTVVLRYPGNGARVAYRRERSQRVPDLWSRLWGEVERSVEVARWLSEQGGIRVDIIDMDLNSDPRFASNKLFNTAVGYVKAHGYEARTKPDMCIASWAADILCNGTPRMHETPIAPEADRGNVTLQIDL